MESPALAEALMAYASGHLSSIDPSYTAVSLAARSNALGALSKTICPPNQETACSETTLSACLILLTSEVCLGSHTSWYNHLVGAKHLITSAQSQSGQTSGPTIHGPEALKLTSEGRWVLRNFAFHDIIGSVTLGIKPLLNPDYLRDIVDEFDTYLGVAAGLLISISEITCLDAPTDTDTGCIPLRAYLDIEQELNSWQCPNDTPPTIKAVAYAYRGTTLIHLYRKMRRQLQALHAASVLSTPLDRMSLETLESKIQTQVSNTIHNISEIPEDHVSESSLLFPLFIVGGETKIDSQMYTIRSRLQSSYHKRRFRNISRALGVLEELWARRKTQNLMCGTLDWEEIVSSSIEPLLLT
ncbi:hypothetical protein FDECE_17123 [Fusarium decemcellulare]|nr:hypothetical protein FDECE_17123 [Fusarium decemcellulare]